MRWGLFPGLLLLGWHDFLPFYLIDNSESQIVAWDFVFTGGLPLQFTFFPSKLFFAYNLAIATVK